MTQNTTSSRSPGERAFPVIDFHVHMLEEEVFKGATDHLVIATRAGTRLRAIVANESALGDVLHAGDTVHCSLHADDIVILPP